MKATSKLRLPGWYKGGFTLTEDDLRNLDLFVDNQSNHSESIRKGLHAKCGLTSSTQLTDLVIEKINDEEQSYYVWVKDAFLFSRLSNYFSIHLSSSCINEVWRQERSSRAGGISSQMPSSGDRLGYRPIIIKGLGSKDTLSTRWQPQRLYQKSAAIQKKSRRTKRLVRSAIVGIGGGMGYVIGKACVTMVVSSGMTASLFIALCTLGGATLFLFLLTAYCYVPHSRYHRFFSSASISNPSVSSSASSLSKRYI